MGGRGIRSSWRDRAPGSRRGRLTRGGARPPQERRHRPTGHTRPATLTEARRVEPSGGEARRHGQCTGVRPMPQNNAPAGATPRGPDGDNLARVQFLTVAEVAAAMRVSKMTVYRLVHNGELPAVRVGRSFRVHAKAVHDMLETSYFDAG